MGRQPWVCTHRRSVPAAAPEPEVDEAPVPDLVGSILSGQSLLMMNGADIIIHRDGSLSAKRAGEVAIARSQQCPRGALCALALWELRGSRDPLVLLVSEQAVDETVAELR